jgi:pimeloyl-ACP methyl ester carboxylesterase
MAFRNGRLDLDGGAVRFRESGTGAALVHLLGEAGGLLTRAHDLLARRFHVTVLEAPAAMSVEWLDGALTALGLEELALWATDVQVDQALALALAVPGRVRSLVLEAPGPTSLEGKLGGLTAPTLVVTGARDDTAAAARGRRFKELMPGVHLVFVYDAGRAVAADRPEAFAEVVGDFLERREAFVISRAVTVIHP